MYQLCGQDKLFGLDEWAKRPFAVEVEVEAMYRVALCEDKAECLEEQRKVTESILSELKINYVVECYTSIEVLHAVLRTHPACYHLLLLNLAPPGMDSMTLARELRHHAVGVSIIFIAADNTYGLEGYAVQAIDYLLKPLQRAALKRAMEYDLRYSHVWEEILVRNGYELKTVCCAELLYVETCYHYVVLHMASGEEERFYGALKDVTRQLPSNRFGQCHKSYCVSLARVQQVGRWEVVLTTGEVLPVSRSYHKAFQSAVMWYYC